MALTATISKESVEKLNEDDYSISISVLIVSETEDVLLDKVYSERYYSALDIDAVKTNLQNQILDDWNRIVDEQNIYNAAAFGTMISEIETAANTYINQ